MGSVFEYITIEKAGEALNVSRSTIYRYIRQGHLRTVKEGQHQLVSRKDVRTLLDLDKKRNQTYAAHKISVAALESRVQVLENVVETMKRLLDIRREPMDLTAPEMLSLYRMAQHHLTVAWSPHDEDQWTDVFARMRLENLETLDEVIEDEDPWRPFHQLCRAILANPHNIDLSLKLNAGKNNLEKLAYIWSKRIGKDAKQLARIVKKDDKAVRALIRRVSRKRPKN
jgi:excisionase family DNA binding protein